MGMADPVAVAVVVMVVVVIVAAMHGRLPLVCPGEALPGGEGPRVVGGQKLTGLSMIALCLPSVPCATMEPSASTTTRTPNRAVMSEVS